MENKALQEDKKIQELEAWNEIHELFPNTIGLYISRRAKVLQAQREQLAITPSQDTSYKIIAISSQLRELEELRKEISYQQSLYQKEVVNERSKGHSSKSTQNIE